MLSNINISLFGNDALIEDEKMDSDISPEAEVKEDPETNQLSKENCFYMNWELIEWMTEPCHPCMAPRSDNG